MGQHCSFFSALKIAIPFLLFVNCSFNQMDEVEIPVTVIEIPDSDSIFNYNLILIIADDLRADAIGYVQKRNPVGRFPWLETPNLDSLISQGAFFGNAFVTTSLCSPSRASILTGKYARNHGIIDNHTPFDQASFVSVLQDKGYKTKLFGKWHMGKQIGPVYGFDEMFQFEGQGAYLDVPFFDNGKMVQTSGWVDEVSSSALLKDLEEMEEDKRFCFILSFKSVHGPWNSPPAKYSNQYQGLKKGIVPNLGSIPPYPDKFYGTDVYDALYDHQDLVYFRNLSGIDEEVGRVCEKLKDLDLLHNTYLIFMSDNGFMMGEHMLRDKRNAYDESIRIPLIIVGPEIPRGIVYEQMVLNVDLAPTIMDLLEVKNTLNVDGNSMKQLFDGYPDGWRNSFTYEYQRTESHGPQSPIYAIRSERFKLIEYAKDNSWSELYDLKNDPFETQNLIANRHVQTQKQDLLQQITQPLLPY